MEYEWYKEDESHTAPVYAARAVLPYLLVANVRAARASYRAFVSSLVADKPNLSVQDVQSQSSDIRVFPSLPLLNFLGLLLLAVQKGSPDLFRQLKSKYAGHIAEMKDWDEPLELIAEMYFKIQRPRQGNPLMDMMSGLFGGGGGGGAPARRQAPRIGMDSAPAAEGLD